MYFFAFWLRVIY